MKIYLRDRNLSIVEAWKQQFSDCENVEISAGDIFGLEESIDSIVSPANSFGFMNGGIDFIYSLEFGEATVNRLQTKIKKDFKGDLFVGQATIVKTDHNKIPYLISAPTMYVPMVVSGTINSYLAFRAALQAVEDFNKTASFTSNPINCGSNEIGICSILCPGLGTAVGMMPAMTCAIQMRKAYDVHFGKTLDFESIDSSWGFHERLRRGVI